MFQESCQGRNRLSGHNFSDIYYMEFMDKERFSVMIDEMQKAHVDVLLFGGDLFSNPQSEKIDAEVIIVGGGRVGLHLIDELKTLNTRINEIQSKIKKLLDE